MLSRLPPASTSPPHRRSSTTERLSHSRSRRRSRFLHFLQSQRGLELRSRFLQSLHEHELKSDSTSEDLEQPLDVTDVGSESELDSPPRITMFLELEPEKEPDFLTSPPPSSPCSVQVNASPPRIVMLHGLEPEESDSPTSLGTPCSVKVNPTWSPKDSPNDEDQYFNCLVDKFVSVAASSTLPYDETDYKTQIHQQSVLCAESALKHYNNDEKNKIKYELISVTICNDMLIREGCFSHVNFTAKANQPNAKDELFFAELRWDHVTPKPTCVICFKGIKKIGGLRDTKYDNFYLERLPVDKQHCYACDHQLKHPKNGELYNIGHIAMSKHYCFS